MIGKKTIHIVEKRNLWFTISLIVIASGFVLMGMRAFQSKPVLNFGIDFISGSSFMLKFDRLNQLIDQANKDNVSVRDVKTSFSQEVRKTLKKKNLDNSVIQITTAQEVIIKCKLQEGNEKAQQLIELLKNDLGNLEVLEIDFIGPTIGAELRETSFWIIIAVTLFLLIYVTWRFEFGFGISSIIALFHDALITISLASLLMIEINTVFVAAVLTILGYSINDTIVVFDRIRENKKRYQKNKLQTLTLTQLSNLSIQQTLKRTINTSLTTTIVILSLLIFGGTTIKSFCVVLLFGILAGTYSSIFIACPCLIALEKEKTEPT